MPGMRYSGLCVLSSLPLLAVLLDAGVTQVVAQDIAAGHDPAPAQSLPSSRLEIGEKLGQVGLLRDVRGNQRWFGEFKDYKAFAVVFMAADCPLSNLYLPRLKEMEQRYRTQQVKFIGVYPNRSETLLDVAAHAEDREVPFLVVKDFGLQLANELGIDRTPQIAVLDGDMVLRYRGRIDDQYSVASRKQEPTSEDLVAALDALVAGEEVAVPETLGDGCLLERETSFPQLEGITYSKHVAPILQRRCQTCHRPGQIGPFPLMNYSDAARRRTMIGEVIEQRRMPPWHADPRYGEFENDRSMPEDEVATIVSWLEAGAPRGNPADLPEPIEWKSDFQIENPDAIFYLPEEIAVPADGIVDYMYFEFDPGFTEDVWVIEGEIHPDAAEVVHHAIVNVLTPLTPEQIAAQEAAAEQARTEGRRVPRVRRFASKTLVNWVPGQQNKLEPPGTALKMPAGATFRWEIHYTPNGVAHTDRTSVAMRFAKEPPERESRYSTMANLRIKIPPDAPHHLERHSFRFRRDGHLVSVRPHMHLRGKSARYEVTYPDGRTETVLSVPNWDFNWQTEYFFKEPLAMPEGSEIHVIAHWDNSDNNPANPDRMQEITYGLQTMDEMMNGWLKYYYDQPLTEGGGRK